MVSKGVEYITLPDVKGMQYDAAVQVLINAGFTCTKIEKENDGTHTAGIVIDTTPQAGKNYEKGKEITGLEAAAEDKNVVVFHAGTKEADGKILTSGGRVLGVTAVDSSIKAARDRAYVAVEKIAFEKNFYRKDIAWRALKR